MLNKTGITKVSVYAENDILFASARYEAVSVIVDKTNYVTENGKKIVKAGTPLSGNLEARGTAFVKATTSDGVSNAVGILRHDVDVTDDNGNGTLITAGSINTDRVDTTTAALLTAEVKKALPKITFAK